MPVAWHRVPNPRPTNRRDLIRRAVSVVQPKAPPLRRRQHGFTLWSESCHLTLTKTRHTMETHLVTDPCRWTIIIVRIEQLLILSLFPINKYMSRRCKRIAPHILALRTTWKQIFSFKQRVFYPQRTNLPYPYDWCEREQLLRLSGVELVSPSLLYSLYALKYAGCVALIAWLMAI